MIKFSIGTFFLCNIDRNNPHNASNIRLTRPKVLIVLRHENKTFKIIEVISRWQIAKKRCS